MACLAGLRTTPGTVVSDHPEEGSAQEARANELVEDVPWDDYYGKDSPRRGS